MNFVLPLFYHLRNPKDGFYPYQTKGKLRKIKKISGFRPTENLCSVLSMWHQSVFYYVSNIGYLCLIFPPPVSHNQAL